MNFKLSKFTMNILKKSCVHYFWPLKVLLPELVYRAGETFISKYWEPKFEKNKYVFTKKNLVYTNICLVHEMPRTNSDF